MFVVVLLRFFVTSCYCQLSSIIHPIHVKATKENGDNGGDDDNGDGDDNIDWRESLCDLKGHLEDPPSPLWGVARLLIVPFHTSPFKHFFM